jgi:hypothetical protein
MVVDTTVIMSNTQKNKNIQLARTNMAAESNSCQILLAEPYHC